ncbi:MAG: tyrosine-type recombinase/integrase [Cetobacterium sp.]
MLPEIFENFLYNLEHAFGKNPKTLKSYRINLTDFNNYMFNGNTETNLDDIKKLHAEDILINFLRIKQSEGMSGASINSRISTIRSFYKWLCARGELTLDISKNIPMFKKETKVCDPLTFEECKQLLDNVRNKMILNTNYETTKMNLMLSILIGAGLRIEELHFLNISNIDKENNCINLTKTKFGKQRSVSIPVELIEDLDIFLDYRLKLNEKLSEDLQDCLFISRNSNRLSVEMIRISVYKEFNELGFEDKDVHSLRKSYVTNMIDAGCPIHVVSSQVGHSNVNTTLSIYNKPTLKDTSEYNKLFSRKEEVKKEEKKVSKVNNVIQLNFGSNVI